MAIRFSSPRERRLWTIAAIWLALIYASLYPVAYVARYLRERNLLRITLALLFSVTLAMVLRWIVPRRPGWREIAVVALAALVYGSLLLNAQTPEEQLHLLEYGILGAILCVTLRERWPGRTHAWWQNPTLVAVLLAAIFGWIDEGIQSLLPNRGYELRDVWMNALSGAVAIGAMEALERVRKGDNGASDGC